MRRIFYTILLSLLVSAIFSQNSLISVQYSVSYGIGDLHDYVKPSSFRGITMDYRKFLKEGGSFGIGLDMSWNVFYEEKPYDTYTNNNITYSGKQYRYSNQFPMLLATDFYMSQGKEFNPFFGFGVGTLFSLRNTYMNFYTFETKAWQFALRPELGFIYELDYGIGLLICSKYYYGFETKDIKGQGYFTFNVGIALQP